MQSFILIHTQWGWGVQEDSRCFVAETMQSVDVAVAVDRDVLL